MHTALTYFEHNNSGCIEKMKVLRSRGMKWDAQTPAFAAAANHLDAIKVHLSLTTTHIRLSTTQRKKLSLILAVTL
jgi:hypothetical protein